MDEGAPLPCVNPEWLTLAGSIFDDASDTRAIQTNSELRRSTFAELTELQSSARNETAYRGLRQTTFDPTLAPSPSPSPPSSPTRTRRFDPTARPFTPKQNPSRLRVDTSFEQEPGLTTPLTNRTPLTPRIQLSPAEDVAASDAAIKTVRQLSRSRRQSSPGSRPTGIQRGISDRKTTVPPPTMATPMSRIVSAPGAYAGPADGRRDAVPASQTPIGQPGNPFLAPVQPMNTGMWLAQTYTVGFDGQVRRPHQHGNSVALPATPRLALSRPRAASTQSHRLLVCNHRGCRHRDQGKTFKMPGELRKHEKTHWPESTRPLGCTVPGCERRFLWPKDVARHVRVVHNKIKVVCEECGARLCREDDLSRHMAFQHSAQAASPSNWVAPSPSASSVASYAMTPRSEYSYGAPGTPLSSFGSAPRPKMPPHLASFGSILEGDYDVPGSVPMSKSLTQ